MNTVENRVIARERMENASNVAMLTSNFTTAPNLTAEFLLDPTESVSEAYNDSGLLPNSTVIGTILRTGLTMQNLTSASPSDEIDHPYYIYLWGLGILGCMVFTTER